jgi:hypothetical protein
MSFSADPKYFKQRFCNLRSFKFLSIAQQVNPILEYFASNTYNKTWAEFIKNYTLATKKLDNKTK